MRDMLARHQIVHSMSRPGYCTDNAEVESFFKSLKGELLHATSFVAPSPIKTPYKTLY